VSTLLNCLDLRRFFRSTAGLLVAATAWDALIVAFLSLFSQPMQAVGQALGLAALLPGPLVAEERVGRIIMVYHALAIPFVAALVYFILELLPFEEKYPRLARPTITVGYMLTSLGGLVFAYGGRNWLAHGVFLAGLSLVFYAGAVLWVGLWPGRRYAHPERAQMKGIPLERLAFWLMALYTLVSAVIGAAAGSFFGNGFTAFLAEDVVREEHSIFHLAIIAHLHIMLTLIDVAILLIVVRYFDLRGRLHRIVMPLIIAGTTIVSFATWSVMLWEKTAHKVINVGAFLLLPAAAMVAFYGFSRLVQERLAAQGITRPTLGQRWRALLHDPVRFGIFFELIFVNAVVTAPGVYAAINLETFRQEAYTAIERTLLVGHWHVLATLSAVIVLFLVMDFVRVRGLLRQLVGWAVLVGSTLSFVFIQFYMIRSPGQDVSWTRPFFETGIGLFLIALAVFLGERLICWEPRAS